MTKASDDVIAERRRQVEVEGFTEAMDDNVFHKALMKAAACYLIFSIKDKVHREEYKIAGIVPKQWPKGWDSNWWKPTTRRRDLVKAAALIIAHIEKIDRAKIRQMEGTLHPHSVEVIDSDE